SKPNAAWRVRVFREDVAAKAMRLSTRSAQKLTRATHVCLPSRFPANGLLVLMDAAGNGAVWIRMLGSPAGAAGPAGSTTVSRPTGPADRAWRLGRDGDDRRYVWHKCAVNVAFNR